MAASADAAAAANGLDFVPGTTFDGKPLESKVRFLLPDAPDDPPQMPNTLFPIETDCFEGTMLPLVKHTNANLPEWFTSKQRQFEFQIQGRFKKVPHGQVWLGLQKPEPLQLSFLRRSAATIIFKFVLAFGRKVAQSWGESGRPGDLPILAFPLLSAMDAFDETPPGEEPPVLGSELKLTPSKRPHSRAERFKLGWTYTFSVSSRYADFERWQVVVPPFGHVDIAGFTERPVLPFVIYMLDEGEDHLVQNMDPVVRWNVVNEGQPITPNSTDTVDVSAGIVKLEQIRLQRLAKERLQQLAAAGDGASAVAPEQPSAKSKGKKNRRWLSKKSTSSSSSVPEDAVLDAAPSGESAATAAQAQGLTRNSSAPTKASPERQQPRSSAAVAAPTADGPSTPTSTSSLGSPRRQSAPGSPTKTTWI
eukprot:m.432594 g.432594  ORF g.432594 m.432594 type:complete len:420 (+) comp20245_c5_seq6:323-1582(+)